ncbi:hypothetical protein CWRG_02216 [Chthonomonas calidirosea]|uniref:hypothetical protein n=1 Tax=Chthonomonas calidirosea TaxID=454171 RepID=UPI0006DD5286|nr:hypothetical protein [Chthonomonas calidirosea]CEK18580.1 hypothetical protein CWRG_02216 [Chthonomonas calidirosea]CEK18581.1 hypothetical protein CP488_02234 [Chthonomonas calidirosea]
MKAKRALVFLLETLHLWAFGVWFGGLVLLLVLSVPFPAANRAPFFLCGLVMLGSEWLLRRRYRLQRPKALGDSLRQTLVLAALFVEELEHSGSHPTVAQQHALEITQVALLALVAAISVWLQVSPPAGEPAPLAATNREQGAAIPANSMKPQEGAVPKPHLQRRRR